MILLLVLSALGSTTGLATPDKGFHQSPAFSDEFHPASDVYGQQGFALNSYDNEFSSLQDDYSDERHHGFQSRYQPSSEVYSAPLNDYSAPKNDYSAPRNDYSVPANDYSAPRNDYSVPANDYSAPRNDYSVPANDYSAPRNDYSVPANDYSAPRNDYSVPANDYSAPRNEYSVPSNDYSSPASDYLAPDNEYSAPLNDYSAGHSVDGHPRYSFKYDVQDPKYGANFGHQESRDGYRTEGQYYVALPDGRLQKVIYVADENGYRADVSYEGEAQYQEYQKQEYQAPSHLGYQTAQLGYEETPKTGYSYDEPELSLTYDEPKKEYGVTSKILQNDLYDEEILKDSQSGYKYEEPEHGLDYNEDPSLKSIFDEAPHRALFDNKKVEH